MLALGLGVLSGMVLNLANETGRVPWYDPVVLSTVSMFAWLVIAAAVGVLYKPARQGRKVAYLTLISFVFLVTVLAVGLFVETQHGGNNRQAKIGHQETGSKTDYSRSRTQDLTVNSFPPTAYRLLPTTHCPLPTAYR